MKSLSWMTSIKWIQKWQNVSHCHQFFDVPITSSFDRTLHTSNIPYYSSWYLWCLVAINLKYHNNKQPHQRVDWEKIDTEKSARLCKNPIKIKNRDGSVSLIESRWFQGKTKTAERREKNRVFLFIFRSKHTLHSMVIEASESTWWKVNVGGGSSNGSCEVS